jgi:ABC-2 type transport system permease protein
MFLGWLGFALMLGRSSLGFTWGQMAVPFLPLLAQTLIFATFALMLSLLLPSRSLAAMVAGVFVALSYFITSLAFMNDKLELVSQLLPYHYYQTVLSSSQLNLTWLFGLFGLSLVMTLLAYARFSRRDIRLSGEGSWRKR